jgi:hypothetical protein
MGERPCRKLSSTSVKVVTEVARQHGIAASLDCHWAHGQAPRHAGPGFDGPGEFEARSPCRRSRDETIFGVDQHEAALGEIRFDLGPFDRATAQPVCFLMPGLDLPADLERQLDGDRRHLFGNQRADGFIDRRPGD